MKKQTLLGAVALTTLAVAGHAAAGTLTTGDVAGATVKTNVTVANDIKIATAGLSGKVGLVFKPSASSTLPSSAAVLSVEVDGGAAFDGALSGAIVVANGVCNPTAVPSTGGQDKGKVATFLVSNLDKCTNGLPLHLLIPVKLDNTNTPVNFKVGLRTEGNTPIDGEPASTYIASSNTNAISFANFLKIETKADTTATRAQLTGGFKALTPDPTIGEVKISHETGRLLGINTSTPVVAADLDKAVFTLTGDLSTLNATVGDSAFTLVDGKYVATIVTNSAAVPPTNIYGTHPINVAVKGAGAVIKASTYSVKTDLSKASAGSVEFKAAALTTTDVALESVTREGATYLVPWVASGTLAKESTSISVVRISNIGEATGPVSIELLSSNAGVAPSTTLVQVKSSIARGEDLVLDSSHFEAALGANFGRGDFRITVEGQPSSLIVRRLIRSSETGALSEVSLGRDGNGASPVN